jgi:hypothetical protein
MKDKILMNHEETEYEGADGIHTGQGIVSGGLL